MKRPFSTQVDEDTQERFRESVLAAGLTLSEATTQALQWWSTQERRAESPPQQLRPGRKMSA